MNVRESSESATGGSEEPFGGATEPSPEQPLDLDLMDEGPDPDPRLPAFYARTNVIAAGIFLALGVTLEIFGIRYGISRSGQPGPGLFPTILGAIVIGLSLFWLATPALRNIKTADEDVAIPDRRGAVYILTTLAAGAAFIFALKPLGYQLTMLIYLCVLLRFVSHKRWIVAIPVSLAFSFGSFFLFVGVLGVQLPAADIPFLKGLGL